MEVSGRNLYFVPKTMMTDIFQTAYGDKFIEEPDKVEEEPDKIEDISTDAIISSDDELNRARLENLKTRTALLNEKIEQRKEELFSEWTEKFFDIFAESFAKFKNGLINLHLGEEQLNILQENLDMALKTMGDNLEKIKKGYIDEDNEEETKVQPN